MLRALIFDLDDTLIESFPGYVSLHQGIARELGWREPSVDELSHYGPTWHETLRGFWPNTDLTPFLERFDQLAHSVVYQPFVGSIEALHELRARGHELFIVTKRSSARLARRLAQAGIDPEWFGGIYPADHGPAAKPDPRCFEPVWERIAWRPDGSPGAVYVGDRNEDRIAARAAGIPFVAVRTGPETRRGFPGDEEPHVIDSIAEFPRWLEVFVTANRNSTAPTPSGHPC